LESARLGRKMRPMSRPVLIILISALVMLGPFTNNIAVPSLPAIATAMKVDFGAVQLVLSVYMAGFAAGQLFVGPMSDKYGRKPVLIVSLTIYVLASAASAFAPDLQSLLAARLVQALGVSATLSIGRAIVRDSFEPARIAQIYAYVGTALALGPIAGPIFGGIIEVAAGWRAVFGFVTAFGGLMLLAILFLLRETNAHLNPDAMRLGRLISNYAFLLSNRLYMGYVLCNAICYGGIFAYTSCSAYILIGLLGVSPDFFGLLYAITVGSYGIGTLVASQFTGRVGLNRMIVLGGLMMTISGEALILMPLIGYFTVWTIVIPFACFCFGTGFVFPSGQAGGITPFPKMAGAAASMLSFLQMTVAAVLGAVTARFLDGTMMPMAWAVFLMGPTMLISFYLLVLRPRRTAARAA
jgi:DHA1 family bicyclomycin/chloramphenicol resistance-like MFS transporter